MPHSHPAAIHFRFEQEFTRCYFLICGLCHISRSFLCNKYLQLILISHLLCRTHFNTQLVEQDASGQLLIHPKKGIGEVDAVSVAIFHNFPSVVGEAVKAIVPHHAHHTLGTSTFLPLHNYAPSPSTLQDISLTFPLPTELVGSLTPDPSHISLDMRDLIITQTN